MFETEHLVRGMSQCFLLWVCTSIIFGFTLDIVLEYMKINPKKYETTWCIEKAAEKQHSSQIGQLYRKHNTLRSIRHL